MLRPAELRRLRLRVRRALVRRRWDHRVEPRLGFLSPLPPAPTGVASYARAVLDGLRRTGFLDRHRVDVVWPVRPEHEAYVPWYALSVYQLGNNVEFHREIYRHAIQTPGLVVLHDLALDDFVRGLLSAGDPLGHQAVRETLALRPRLAGAPDLDEPLRVPWLAHVARRARGIVVHADFGRRYLERIGCRTPVFVVPHPVVEDDRALARAARRAGELRAAHEARGMRTLVGVLGDLNAAKLVEVVLAAVGRLDPSVHVVLVGRRIDGYDVGAALAAAGLGERAALHPDVPDEDFRAWLAAVDVVVDLRHPHRGEVSGTLFRALQAGKPAVVSATGSYLDLPDDAVRRVPRGRPAPEEVARALGELAGDPGLRARMGAAGRAYVDGLRQTEATARGYAAAIEGTLALVRDPARRALARWAGALADLGATEEDLAEGYGTSYARALATFADLR